MEEGGRGGLAIFSNVVRVGYVEKVDLFAFPYL